MPNEFLRLANNTGVFSTHDEEDVTSASGKEESETDSVKALRARYESHDEQIKNFGKEVKDAQRRYDSHQLKYESLLQSYMFAHKETSVEINEQNFGPIYLQQWQDNILGLKNTEEALETARRAAAAELNNCSIAQKEKEDENQYLEEVTEVMNHR